MIHKPSFHISSVVLMCKYFNSLSPSRPEKCSSLRLSSWWLESHPASKCVVMELWYSSCRFVSLSASARCQRWDRGAKCLNTEKFMPRPSIPHQHTTKRQKAERSEFSGINERTRKHLNANSRSWNPNCVSDCVWGAKQWHTSQWAAQVSNMLWDCGQSQATSGFMLS